LPSRSRERQAARPQGVVCNFGGGNVDEALSQIFTDFVFACNGFDSNSDLSKQVPVFAYEFNDPNAPPGVNGSGFTTASQHAAELAYIFNFGAPFTDAQKSLAANMKTYWANFVKTRNPNNNGGLVVLASNSGGGSCRSGSTSIPRTFRSSRSHRLG
jgi:carboxylesterase type B